MERDDLAAWLRLELTPGVSNESARRLLAAFGLPATIFTQATALLRQIVDARTANALDSVPPNLEAILDSTFQWLGGATDPMEDRRIVTLGDPDYPPALLNIADPPLMLYMMGMRCGQWPHCVAVVGSRNPTPQGAENARQFSKAFGQIGVTVVSGLALGIDGAAHEGSLDGAAPGTLATIAVVGTGLDRVYPKQHLELAHRIVERGLIISEYPLGTPPLQHNFPRRNRIIAALSQGTLVVEAALKSGSLITARQALEQGKDVFAIPGSIHSPQSRGCHALLKDGAKLVESAQDVLEELRFAVPSAATPDASTDQVDDDLDQHSDDRGLLRAMGYDPLSLDALVARTGIGAATLQAQLLELELIGKVARLPGGLFQRQVRA